MSNTGAGPWSVFAELFRQGIDNFVATQKTILDIAVQQNAAFTAAVQQSLGGAMTPALSDLAGRSAKAFVESQKMMLDLALQQNRTALNMVKAGLPQPFVTEIADMLAEGAAAFGETQKRLLEFAGEQADAMVKSAREGQAMPNPLPQMAELSRAGVQALAEVQKKFLDMLAQGIGSATERMSQPGASSDPAAMARQAFQNYLDLQHQLAEGASRQMADWTRAWQTGASSSPAQTIQDVARQSVEAFLNTQRAILDLAFRSMSATNRS